MIRVTFSKEEGIKDGMAIDHGLTDLLKSISCIMVALSHYSGYVLANGVSTNIIYKVIAANGGYIGVAVFFFLSGYGLMMSDMKHHLELFEFCKRRLSRTWLPAVMVSFIWLGISIIFNETLLCNQHYFLGVIWWFNDEVMWFVRTIIVMYLFFYLFRVISKNTSRIEPLILITIGAFATPLVRWMDLGDPISVPLFFIGIAIARWQNMAVKLFKARWFILTVIIVILSVAYIGRTDNRVLHGAINYMCITGMVSLLASIKISITSLPKWISTCSYDVYLVHYKTHLFILNYMPVDTLGLFLGGTILSTTIFHKLRKLMRI